MLESAVPTSSTVFWVRAQYFGGMYCFHRQAGTWNMFLYNLKLSPEQHDKLILSFSGPKLLS